MSARVGGPLLLAATVIGCGSPVVVDGFKVDQAEYTRQLAAVKKRAAFDLKCGEDQVQTTLLAAMESVFPTQFGITGCDHRAVYVYVAPAGWVMNTNNGQPAQR